MTRAMPTQGVSLSPARLTLLIAGLSLTLGTANLGKSSALAQDLPSALPALAAEIQPQPQAQPPVRPHPKQAESTPAGPPIPPLPSTIPDAVVPPNSGIVGLSPGPADNLGIGLLQPQNLSFLDSPNGESNPLAYGRWLRSVALPLYTRPNGELWGWMVNGWLMIDGYEPIAIGQDASFSMVEAQPGLYSFPVLEQQADGWFRFQYTPAGSAWAHVDHLKVGAVALTVQPWADVLTTAPQIRFRRHGLSQSLRTEPGTNAALQTLVAPNSRIRPLAIEGDWMQVEVIQPVQGCTALPGHTTESGWLRWRDDNQALLVWTVYADCPPPASE